MKKLQQSDLSRRGAANNSLIWIVALIVAFIVALVAAIASSGDLEEMRNERDAMRAERDKAKAERENDINKIYEISTVLGFYPEGTAVSDSPCRTPFRNTTDADTF